MAKQTLHTPGERAARSDFWFETEWVRPRETREWADVHGAPVLVDGVFELLHVGVLQTLRCAYEYARRRNAGVVALIADDGFASALRGDPVLDVVERIAALSALPWLKAVVPVGDHLDVARAVGGLRPLGVVRSAESDGLGHLPRGLDVVLTRRVSDTSAADLRRRIEGRVRSRT